MTRPKFDQMFHADPEVDLCPPSLHRLISWTTPSKDDEACKELFRIILEEISPKVDIFDDNKVWQCDDAIIVHVGDPIYHKTIFSCHIGDDIGEKPENIHPFMDEHGCIWGARKGGGTYIPYPLGAYSKLGAWIMIEMIRSEVKGTYIFHRRYGVGDYGPLTNLSEQFITQHNKVISFSLEGDNYISGLHGRYGTATKPFIEDLKYQLSLYTIPEELGLEKGAPLSWVSGIQSTLTPAVKYRHWIKEIVDISCGADNFNTREEYINIPWCIGVLIPALCEIDWGSFEVEMYEKAEDIPFDDPIPTPEVICLPYRPVSDGIFRPEDVRPDTPLAQTPDYDFQDGLLFLPNGNPIRKAAQINNIRASIKKHNGGKDIDDWTVRRIYTLQRREWNQLEKIEELEFANKELFMSQVPTAIAQDLITLETVKEENKRNNKWISELEDTNDWLKAENRRLMDEVTEANIDKDSEGNLRVRNYEEYINELEEQRNKLWEFLNKIGFNDDTISEIAEVDQLADVDVGEAA